jgi:hypothetical protein
MDRRLWMLVLINGQRPIGDGPGITFDLDHLERLAPPKLGRPGKLASMPDLLRRIIPRVGGPVRGCIIPDQIYVDLHWMWTGYKRRGSPIAAFAGKELHVALCLWSLWQNWPRVARGPIRRLCLMEGCCNPHHYHFPFEPHPAPMTFSVTGDPGQEAAAALLMRHQEIERMIADDTREHDVAGRDD